MGLDRRKRGQFLKQMEQRVWPPRGPLCTAPVCDLQTAGVRGWGWTVQVGGGWIKLSLTQWPCTLCQAPLQGLDVYCCLALFKSQNNPMGWKPHIQMKWIQREMDWTAPGHMVSVLVRVLQRNRANGMSVCLSLHISLSLYIWRFITGIG